MEMGILADAPAAQVELQLSHDSWFTSKPGELSVAIQSEGTGSASVLDRCVKRVNHLLSYPNTNASLPHTNGTKKRLTQLEDCHMR